MKRREFCKRIMVLQSPAQFLWQSASQRIFHALVDGKLVEKKLNETDWSSWHG